jgi:hypothetical protein
MFPAFVIASAAAIVAIVSILMIKPAFINKEK